MGDGVGGVDKKYNVLIKGGFLLCIKFVFFMFI